MFRAIFFALAATRAFATGGDLIECSFTREASVSIFDAFRPGGNEALFETISLDCGTLLRAVAVGGEVGAVVGGAFRVRLVARIFQTPRIQPRPH